MGNTKSKIKKIIQKVKIYYKTDKETMKRLIVKNLLAKAL